MKVALLNSYYCPDELGGAEVVVRRLATSMLELGMDVRVLSLTGGNAVTRQVRDGVPVVRVPAGSAWPPGGRGRLGRLARHARDRWNRAMAARIAAVLRNDAVDLVNTHNLIGISPAIWTAAAKAGINVVHTLHDHKLLCPRGTATRAGGEMCTRPCGLCRVYTAPYPEASRAVSAVAAVSRYILSRHLDAGCFTGVPARVVGNPVPALANPLRPARGARLRLGYLGRLAAEKGVGDLIAAVRTLAPAMPIELVIAGAGPDEAELRRAGRGLAVELVGHVAPRALFERIDLLVVPSRCRESFGLAAVEAQAQGIPVLASARGGLAELIDHGHTGWLYEPDDPGGLPAAISACAGARASWDEVSRAAARAAARHRSRDVAERYLALFESARARRVGPAEAA